MADPVDVEHTNLATAASLGRPDGTDATRDREEMSASSDGPSAAVASNSSVVDVWQESRLPYYGGVLEIDRYGSDRAPEDVTTMTTEPTRYDRKKP